MIRSTPDFSGLFYMNPSPSWIYELITYKIKAVNTAALLHYNFTKIEFLNLSLKEVFHQESNFEIDNTHKNIPENTDRIDFGIQTHYTKSGVEIKVETIGFQIDYDQKKCILVVCQDVTEREKKFELLHIAQSRLDMVYKISKLGYWRLNLDYTTLTWSSGEYKIWGRTKKNFRVNYQSFLDTIHPADIEIFKAQQHRMINDFKVLDFVHRIILPDNSIRWVHELGQVITDSSGKPLGFEGTTQDITHLKKEEQRLRLLESVVTHTNDAVVISSTDADHNFIPQIIYVNDAFTNMTGYTSDEVIGKSPKMLQGSGSNKEALHALSVAIKNWKPCEITTINYKKDGSEFWVNFSVVPVADEKGTFTHWIAIERDVTQKKVIELEKDLLAQISLAFNTKNDYSIAAEQLCELVGKFGSFDWVELWISNADKNEMRLFSHYLKAAEDVSYFDYSKTHHVFHISEGLAGKVFADKKPYVCCDSASLKNLLRSEGAQKIGLNAVIGIPLLFENTVMGILKIGTKSDGTYLKKYTQLFEHLEQYVGAELHRKKLEYDLSHLFNSIPDIICISDFDGRFLKINKAGCALLGYNESEILNYSFEKFIHPDDLDYTVSELHRLAKQMTTFKLENRYLTKNGETIWLSWYATFAVEEKIIYATAKDITAEKNLRELNRQVADLARIGSWEIDFFNQTVFWSEEVYRLLEINHEVFEPSFDTGLNYLREDFQPLVQSTISNCFKTGASFDFEAVIITADLHELWVRIIGNGTLVNDKCKRIYGSIQDINKLKESENRLISFSENLPGVVYQYSIHPDRTESLQYISGNVQQFWGYTAAEVMTDINLVWDQVKAGGDYEEIQASVLKSIRTKSKWVRRYRQVMPNGELRTRLGSGTPTFLADGTIIYDSIALDITKEAKNESLLNHATELARIGSWELDLINVSDHNLYCSPMVNEILEIKQDINPTFTRFLEHYVGESQVRQQHVMQLLIDDGIEFDDEFLIKSAKGNEYWIRCIGKSEMANNKRTKVFGSFQDISQQKLLTIRLNELNITLLQHANELERSNKELEQFAFIASHDLQEPLRMVSSFMDQLKRKYGNQLDEKAHQYIYFATDGAKRMKQIILDLLDYSRANKQTEAIERIDLNDLFFEYTQLRRKIISEKSAFLTAEFLPILTTYKAAVVQIIHCLLDNSLKYSRPDVTPKITLKVVENQQEWIFSIHDNGIGIDAQFFEKIFIIFQRLHNKEEYEGTGIGLSIAKRHIEFLGGRIWVDSAEGAGSTFYFTIPKKRIE